MAAMGDAPRVLLVSKRPLAERLGPTDSAELASNPDIGLQTLRAAAAVHAQALAGVRAALADLPVRERLVDELDGHDADNADLVVTVGGDGTVFAVNALSATRPVITVNSDPERSVGHFSRCTLESFPALLAAWRAGRHRIEAIARLEVTIDRDGSHCFLNDCLFTSRNPAAITRYLIEVDGQRERQHSSGIWISTAAGSTGGIRSAGMDPLPPGDRALLWRVREPFQGRSPAILLSGRQSPPRGLRVTAMMPNIDLYLDGPHRQIPLRYGGVAEFRAHPDPLPLAVLA
jgi:NAD+ kinase